ncbi:MAG: hypothetical protein Ct9H300mP8_11570 [Gammaproteobacteria bacterium]|nr:MAG: hypothetical protein Ct9H300mP8_11570 [Gammaproteobacteria bacterium]
MDTRSGFAEAVGNTPLIRLKTLSEETGCEILGKAEFMNPGGSVKDRAALWMIAEAEKSGQLLPGGTVVEGTAGNTGIGIAHICNARGYPCIIYMPDNQSPEKIEILETLGAEVRVVPTVPYKDEMNYQKQAGRFAGKPLTAPYGQINSTTQRTGLRITSQRGPKSGDKRTARWTPLSVRSEPAAPSLASRSTLRNKILPYSSFCPTAWGARYTTTSPTAKPL